MAYTKAQEEILSALETLTGNAKEVKAYLATRHPEEGGTLVYTPLEPMLKVRDEQIERLKKAEAELTPQDRQDAAWVSAVASAGKVLADLEAQNNAKLDELAGFYKGKLKNAKQARDTVTAYKQEYQTMMDMNVGSFFNQAQ